MRSVLADVSKTHWPSEQWTDASRVEPFKGLETTVPLHSSVSLLGHNALSRFARGRESG